MQIRRKFGIGWLGIGWLGIGWFGIGWFVIGWFCFGCSGKVREGSDCDRLTE